MFQDISGLFLQQCVIWMLECQNCWLKQNWVAKEWKLDIDLKLTGTLPETSNILHFLVPGSNGEHGWRIPAIFCRKNKPILDIYSSVGDNHVHSYKTKELNLYQWYSFRWFFNFINTRIFNNHRDFLFETKKSILQKREDKEIEDGAIWGDSHVFQVWIDGVQVYSGRFNHCIAYTVWLWQLHFWLSRKWFQINQVINPEPRTFEGVKGYIANNGANITPGFYRNYHYIADNTNNNVHIHQVNSKASISWWDSFRPIQT